MSEQDKLDPIEDGVTEEFEAGEKETKAVAVTSRYPDKERERKEKERKKEKKEFFLVRFGKWVGRKVRDLIAELKKVTWPGFPKVVKQTGIVIGVVLFFLVIVFAIDLGLSQLYRLLVDALVNG